MSQLQRVVERGSSESAKVRALELIGKELGMFADNSDSLSQWDGDLNALTTEQFEKTLDRNLRQMYPNDPQAAAEVKRQLLTDPQPVIIDTPIIPALRGIRRSGSFSIRPNRLEQNVHRLQ